MIVNRESQKRLSEVWETLHESAGPCDLCVSVGGPVQGPLISLHGHPQYSESEILPGVYIATQRETLADLLTQNLQPYRVFAGYAGWGPGQLEKEFRAGGWLHTFGTPAHIFSEDPSGVWHEALQASGQDFLRDTLGIHKFPDDAGMN